MPLFLGGGVSSQVNRRFTSISEWTERRLRDVEEELRPTVVTVAPPTVDGTADGLLGSVRLRVEDTEPRIYMLGLSTNSKPQWRELLSRKTDSGEPFRFYQDSTDDMTDQDGSLLNIEQDGTGDAAVQFELSGGQTYSIGIDNSDSDNWELYDVTRGAEVLTVDTSGNLTLAEVVRITADGGLFMDNQGSNPGVLANKAALFSKDVSTVAEMFVMDEGGTATQISPHNPATGEWWFHEYDAVSDITRVFHIERLFNFLISRFPALASEWYEEVRGELTDPKTLASHKVELERPSRALPDEPEVT